MYTFSGHCEHGATESRLWTFRPENGSADGSWSKNTLSALKPDANATGTPSFLSAGMAFSSITNGSAALYVFGGMCPKSSTTSQNWQSSAAYSNQLISMQAGSQVSPSSLNFDVSVLSSRGPPIPEAGFTITPLQRTSAQSARGAHTQQQNFVLLGGQTPTAFINMSQVALFSLPEENWTFLPVADPLAMTTDLAVRATTVDPRSGHTAILSDDGRQIIVFGGWVGDLSTPAEPQLAILQLGSGYGGTGDWQWMIPTSNKADQAPRSGIYGHASVLLPGGVMMVVGGYQVSGLASPAKRDSSNEGTYFFNISSNTWQSSYTNPIPNLQSPSDAPAADSDHLRKIGLGTGLGLGFLAILAALAVYFLYRRHSRRNHELCKEDARNLSLAAHRFSNPIVGVGGGIDGRGAEASAASWIRERSKSSDAYPWAPSIINNSHSFRSTEAERTGLLIETPSPTRGLRRSIYSRNVPPPLSRLDEGHRHRTSNIHPIDERAEYEEASSKVPEMAQIKDMPDPFISAPILDPFVDPHSQSRSPSPPSPARARDMEIQTWVSDWSSASGAMHSGRVSPEKPSERTSSTLSDQSTLSSISGFSVPRSVSFLSRSISQRSAALFTAVNPLHSAPSTSPTMGQSAIAGPGPVTARFRRSQSLNSYPPEESRLNTAESFATAATTFTQLQAEGEGLLGRPEIVRHDIRNADTPQDIPSSSQVRTRGWMGSVRRALLGERNPTTLTEMDQPESPHTSARSSPTRMAAAQRASTTGSALWQARRGRRDWDVEGGDATDGHESDDEDWDVESAVERRVVQVMFTVPRGELRIINGGGEVESLTEVEGITPRHRQTDESAEEEKE